MILKRAPHIPDAVSGGQDTVGIRCPSHPVAIRLLQAFKGGKGGVAAPSANKFGHVSPTTAQHVRDEFGDDIGAHGRIAFVLDGGQSEVGIESTIVDLSRLATHGPVLLRPGHISADAIAAVIDQVPARPDAAPRALPARWNRITRRTRRSRCRTRPPWPTPWSACMRPGARSR
jgi:L-threonylcarbamoyladenylate synthase